LLADLEELRDTFVDLKMEVATLRSENKAMQTKLVELEKANFELKTVNEILKRK
jgi:FtsZ-binding cell division protein ZapB